MKIFEESTRIINEDFITYELAKKLKEKGSDWQTFDWYDMAGNFCKGFMPRELMCREYYAPTISQVLKWLREEKKMHIIVEIADSGWYYTVYPNIRWENGKLKSDTYIMSFKNKDSYEQAALAGIEYVLGNLI